MRRSIESITMIVSLGALLCSLGGCVPNGLRATRMSAEDYDQSCEVASDCAVVSEGSVCDCGCEDYAAIRADELEAWSEEQSRKRDNCTSTSTCFICREFQGEVGCSDEGRCVLRAAPDTGSGPDAGTGPDAGGATPDAGADMGS